MTTVEDNGYTPATTYGGSTAFNGMKIETTSGLPTGTKLVACLKNSNGSNANAPQLRASNGTTVLATGSAWSSNSSTFDYTLSASTTYYIGFVGDGSASSFTWQNVQSFPVNGTYLNWTASIGTFATTYPVNIEAVTLETPVSQTVMASTLTMSTSQPTPTVFVSAIVTPDTSQLSINVNEIQIINGSTYWRSEGPGTKGTRIVKTSYPNVAGLTLGTTKISGRNPNLKYDKSNVPRRDKQGL